MTRKGKSNLKRFLMYHIREKGAVVLLGLLFLAGVAAGSQIYPLCDGEQQQFLNSLFHLQQDSTLMESFHSNFLSESAQLGLLFLCGFCAIGQPVAAFLLLFRGLGLGMTGACLAQQGREAFGYYALVLLPQTLLFLLLQIAATREAIAFSMGFLRQLLGMSGMRGLTVTARVYLLRFLLLFFLCILAAFGGALLSLFLSRLLH